ncbi:hypothetical protein OXPF_00330 [Oxobacter pfennigii]|uniref:Uncharacterized protein n=1 Tax=Oxobacter pfennigii TaxID=36849 RepID=A0A0P8YGZ4_9CLOT|nr:hypothetical protein [Oxobacter pfennigii]KPU46361.1 hypothetical protein OXPF_00330 [Oxobacter pfennigii]
MTIGIGIIISKNHDISLINNLKENYDLGLIRIHNDYVDKQLLDDEVFLQATKNGCDSLTGIGIYDLYIKDVSEIYQAVKDPKMAQFLISDFEKRKGIYKNDAKKWIEIAKTIKYDYNVNKFGLFIHFFISSFDREKIDFHNRTVCSLNNVTIDYIMKIQKDVIVFFD